MDGTIRDRTTVQSRPNGASGKVLEAPDRGFFCGGLIAAWEMGIESNGRRILAYKHDWDGAH